MDAAIACLERELATLANNFAVSADAKAHGKEQEGDAEQQDLRWRNMDGLRRGIASLRYANQKTGPIVDGHALNEVRGAANIVGRFGQTV